MTSRLASLIDGTTRSRLVSRGYWTWNWAKVGSLALRVGPWPLWKNSRRYPWLTTLLKVNQLHDTMTEGRHGRYKEAVAFVISSVVSSITEYLSNFINQADRTVLHEDLVPPEILYGMGLNPWMVELLGIVVPMVDRTAMETYIDVAENTGIPPDICSLPKSTIGLTLKGHLPPGAALVTSNMPCDGGMSQYTLIQRALGVPTYRLDIPYQFYSERAVDYFVGELTNLIAWLEEHTPGRMDWDRMREVCEERNRAMEAELELWDLLRARPAPMAAEPVYLSHLMYVIAQPGTPRATQVFRRVRDLARENLVSQRGALSDERHRVALWNPPTLIAVDLFAWAEQKYGAALIMDMLTYHRHPFIDTTSPATMLRDLARVIMQGPMARHTRGPAENFFGDLFTFYRRFDLDMIWMAAHIGCKNTQALLGMFRERCRARKIPLLIIDYDLSDTRICSPEGVRAQVEQFMETVMGERKRQRME